MSEELKREIEEGRRFLKKKLKSLKKNEIIAVCINLSFEMQELKAIASQLLEENKELKERLNEEVGEAEGADVPR